MPGVYLSVRQIVHLLRNVMFTMRLDHQGEGRRPCDEKGESLRTQLGPELGIIHACSRCSSQTWAYIDVAASVYFPKLAAPCDLLPSSLP